MKSNCNASTSLKGENLQNKGYTDWQSIDWQSVTSHVRHLQIKISKAYANGKTNLAKRLSYLLTHSFDAKLLAVKRVTGNQGANTPGVDGIVLKSDKQKWSMAKNLTDKHYHPKPLRRILIPKKNGKTRPLSIPTIYDRCMQTLYGFALDPIQEAMADPNSYGFRIGRGCKDASEYLFILLATKRSAQWILDCDVKSCFDRINHDWLLDNIPMDTQILRKFLKAGFVYEKKLFPTDEGTPQGGAISTILANMTLNGMEKMLLRKYREGTKVHLCRFADDFVVTCPTEELCQKVRSEIELFLEQRGLELSEEKTRILHINEGFDFLSYNFRKYDGKLLITPSKKSVKSLKLELSKTVKYAINWTQDDLIKTLNQKMRGWCNYHDATVHSKVFNSIDHHVFRILVKWARKRHPRKEWSFITDKYWHRKGSSSWTFSTDKQTLVRAGSFSRKKHVKIRSTTNAYLDYEYLLSRSKQRFVKAVPVKRD